MNTDIHDMSALPISLGDIAAARYRLSRFLAPSPLEAAPELGEGVSLKLECANPTRSFKVRGALNAMLALDQAARARGVIAASTGNHAQGIAYAAKQIGVRAQILMPNTAPRKKVAGVRRSGGEAILFGEHYDQVENEARRRERDEGLTYISPYNDRFVAAGQGTIGLEILDQVADVERVIVPVGGGGLISGIAVAIKAFQPSCEIIGVNTAVSPEMYNIFYGESRPCSSATLADSLPGDIEADSITRVITRSLVSRIVLVSEAEIAAAMKWLVVEHGWIGEGGGVAGIAAVLAGQIPLDKKTVIVVSGGNVDAEVLARVLGG